MDEQMKTIASGWKVTVPEHYPGAVFTVVDFRSGPSTTPNYNLRRDDSLSAGKSFLQGIVKADAVKPLILEDRHGYQYAWAGRDGMGRVVVRMVLERPAVLGCPNSGVDGLTVAKNPTGDALILATMFARGEEDPTVKNVTQLTRHQILDGLDILRAQGKDVVWDIARLESTGTIGSLAMSEVRAALEDRTALEVRKAAERGLTMEQTENSQGLTEYAARKYLGGMHDRGRILRRRLFTREGACHVLLQVTDTNTIAEVKNWLLDRVMVGVEVKVTGCFAETTFFEKLALIEQTYKHPETPAPKQLPSTNTCVRCKKGYEAAEDLPPGAECPHCHWPRLRSVEAVAVAQPFRSMPLTIKTENAVDRATIWRDSGLASLTSLRAAAREAITRKNGSKPQEEVDLHWELMDSLGKAEAVMTRLSAYLRNVAR